MLQVGNAGFSPVEARTHFFAWALVAAPLLIGADVVSGLDSESLALLSAPVVVAVDQDALGVQVRANTFGGARARVATRPAPRPLTLPNTRTARAPCRAFACPRTRPMAASAGRARWQTAAWRRCW